MNNFERFESEPSDGPTALEEAERQELLAGIAAERARSANEAAANEINRDPELHSMLSKLINGGPELSDGHKGHLRKMIALKYAYTYWRDEAAQAQMDRKFHGQVIGNVYYELEELEGMAADGAEELPDLWDIAYQDLCSLENGDDPDA